MNILFNPDYVLKPDVGRVLLLPFDTTRSEIDVFDSFIHPIHAIILSFVKGDSIEDTINNASNYLDVDKKYIENFITPLINNNDKKHVKIGNNIISFPPNTIISSTKKSNKIKTYNPSSFFYKKLDMRFKRHYTPSRITLMLTNKCVTNCFYCYADRRKKTDCKIQLDRIIKIIDEAKKLNVIDFNVIRGEFFLYKYWREVLSYLYKKDYIPFVSTKVPIDVQDVAFLKSIKIKDIQFSLDTLIPEHLKYIVGVRDKYMEHVKETLYLLNKYKINTIIHSIINAKNDTIEDMNSIYEYIKDFDNIVHWRVDLVGPSIYLRGKSYYDIKYNNDNVLKLIPYFKTTSENSIFPIKYSSLYSVSEEKNITYDEKLKVFNNRGICSGNFSSLFILPDGKVTICEELYWHPQFIIGNIIEQSLEEVWNSQIAHEVYAFKQQNIAKNSACAVCEEYEKCRSLKQVCWRDIIRAYGSDNWTYPDPNCPKSPTPIFI